MLAAGAWATGERFLDLPDLAWLPTVAALVGGLLVGVTLFGRLTPGAVMEPPKVTHDRDGGFTLRPDPPPLGSADATRYLWRDPRPESTIRVRILIDVPDGTPPRALAKAVNAGLREARRASGAERARVEGDAIDVPGPTTRLTLVAVLMRRGSPPDGVAGRSAFEREFVQTLAKRGHEATPRR